MIGQVWPVICSRWKLRSQAVATDFAPGDPSTTMVPLAGAAAPLERKSPEFHLANEEAPLLQPDGLPDLPGRFEGGERQVVPPRVSAFCLRLDFTHVVPFVFGLAANGNLDGSRAFGGRGTETLM